MDIRGSSTPLASQVGGHEGVMSDASGGLVIKPALPREIAFYQLLASAKQGPLASLRPYVPKFFGTLRLEGQLEGDAIVKAKEDGVEVATPESVVLQNLSHLYTRPCILDVKLGTELYAPEATEEKKARMEKTAKATTSFKTGLRLTGFQTWDPASSSYISTPKTFGKSISPAELPNGIIRFFPLLSDEVANLVDTSAPPYHGCLSRPLLIRTIQQSLLAIRKLKSVLEKLEMRFVGASILLVYEGDEDKLREAFEHADAGKVRGDGGEPDVAIVDDEESEDEEEDEASTASDADSEADEICPPITLRMIDFAHTWLVEGEGPDRGVLKGVETLESLFEGRLKALESSQE